MSAYVYPSTLRGLTFGNIRTPMFKTNAQEAITGKESRQSLSIYPQFRFNLQYEWLDDIASTSDLKTLVGFFGYHRGAYDSFLYTDPTYNSVTAQLFGTGNGTTTAFQLIATYGNSALPGTTEIVQNLNGAPSIYDNGSLRSTPTHYSIGPTGIVTFVSPPVSGHLLTWTGSFYYRCRFMDDDMDFEQFMYRFWAAKKVSFKSIKL